MELKKSKENHKQRAYLNSLTSIIDQIAKQVMGFVVNPFVVKGLGNSLFGVYQIVLEISGYANLADTQSTQVLKWTLAKNRNVFTKEELRSEISTGLYIIFLILPFLLIVGAILSWFAPTIMNVDAVYEDLVRKVSAIVIFAVVISKFSNFFESILRGLNLGYKGMGVKTLLIVIGGICKIFVINYGYGLIGLVLLQVIIAFLTVVIFFYLVKKNVPWFALGKTNKNKIISYTKLSGWFMATKVAGMVLFNSEKILLGFFIGPEIVTIYVLTMFTTSALKGVLDSVVSGVIPGIGTFFGLGEFDKIRKSRLLISNLIWFTSFSFGNAILLFNPSFLNLWVGRENFAGSFENFLILLMAIQYIFFFTTGNFINVTLDLKTKVYLTGLSAIVSIGFAYFLIPLMGISGLCLSVLLGRSILSIGFPIILNRKINNNNKFITLEDLRISLLSLLGLALASYFQSYINIENWYILIISGILVTLISGLLFWVFVIENQNKKLILEQLKKIKMFKTN
ncbi:oligosaccharide flippase family protein [Aquiflexum sp. LQ15W]|uniref:oligosaccharide flippase family protein n=1 Tax=Cognataquiflexum nitidum TaxID=2922272 RepID=UPI001F13C610|nr:oligosaccharide flippase family protein [Cognataquiflexum nitidum]MCH6201734.1 oligosaccharide flippase family protein [Cognataquiflexum nitidum]